MAALPERKKLAPRPPRPPLQRQPDSGTFEEILSPRDKTELAMRLSTVVDAAPDAPSQVVSPVVATPAASPVTALPQNPQTSGSAGSTLIPTRKPGRPPKQRIMRHLSTSMESELRDTVDRWRKENDVSMVDLIDEAVREYLGLKPFEQ